MLRSANFSFGRYLSYMIFVHRHCYFNTFHFAHPLNCGRKGPSPLRLSSPPIPHTKPPENFDASQIRTTAASLEHAWPQSGWRAPSGPLSAADVSAARSVQIDTTLAAAVAESLTWQHRALRQHVRRDRNHRAAGQGRPEGVYLSGLQVAGDANIAGEMYPDHSLPRRIGALSSRASTHFTPATDQCRKPRPTSIFAPRRHARPVRRRAHAFELMRRLMRRGRRFHIDDRSLGKKCPWGQGAGPTAKPTLTHPRAWPRTSGRANL